MLTVEALLRQTSLRQFTLPSTQFYWTNLGHARHLSAGRCFLAWFFRLLFSVYARDILPPAALEVIPNKPSLRL